MGLTPTRVRLCRVWRSLYLRVSDHVECRGVYIFNSEYRGKKIEIESTSKQKNTTVTSLKQEAKMGI